MSSNYLKIDIDCPDELKEIVTAELELEEIDVFEDTSIGMAAYIQEDKFTEELHNTIRDILAERNLYFTIEIIPYQNWNSVWESNFQSIQIGNYVGVRADFHPVNNDVQFDLVINPKMAFGTGHHETTWQVLEMMHKIDFTAKKILDYGCGTGILGILALKSNAALVIGNDIAEESILNTVENCKVNRVNGFDVRLGTLDTISETDFDIILANINRNVIVDSLPGLYKKLKEDGILVTSGYMLQDKNVIEQNLAKQDFKIVQLSEKGNWMCHYSVKV
ncbi:MAG TPA: 50S ribosomal protein L11 methyltransferase [Saprospiraceae bacterium]|nr:50S ribosomal protein L11 methyltransferase [Saprospiraceae bacterium]